MDEIAKWATTQFARLRSAQHIHGAGIQEMLDAEVDERRIELLYPFDLKEYVPSMESVLRENSNHFKIFEALESVDVPHRLAPHLPLPHSNVLSNYVREQGVLKYRSGPEARIAIYSEELAELVKMQLMTLAPVVETMLQLPRWLHVMRDHPFPGLIWPRYNQLALGKEIKRSGAKIEEYISALSL